MSREDQLVTGERRRRLEQVETMRTLCSGLAHEVRNPLNSAKLQLELAQRRLRRHGDHPKVLEPIVLASQEIARLTKLLDEFLAFALPHALDSQPQDVIAIVRQVVAAAEPRGARLTLRAPAEPIVAEVDAPKLRL